MASMWTYGFVVLAGLLALTAGGSIMEAIIQFLQSPQAAQLKHWFLLSYGICLPIVLILDWRTGACFLCVALVKMATVPADAFLGTHSRTRTPFANLRPWRWRLIACPCFAVLFLGALLPLPHWLMAPYLQSDLSKDTLIAATIDAATVVIKSVCARGAIAVLAASSRPWIGLAKWKAAGDLDRMYLVHIPLYCLGAGRSSSLFTAGQLIAQAAQLDPQVSGSRWFPKIALISSLSIALMETACVAVLSLYFGLDLLRSLGLASSVLAGVMLCPSRDQLRCWQWKARSWLHLTNPTAQQEERKPCLFFETLPTDIQLHVLQSWLGDQDGHQLLALSALDMACTKHSLRQQLLHLLSHPSNRWDCNGSHLVPGCMLSYMHWLHARQITVRELYLTAFNVSSSDLWPTARPFVLPSVERIVLWKMPDMGRECVEMVLQMCPNATSIEQELVPASPLMKLTQLPIWMLIPCFPNNMTSVCCCPNYLQEPSRKDLFMTDAVLSSLGQAAGRHLQILRVSFDKDRHFSSATVAILSEKFIALRILEIRSINFTASTKAVIQLVNGCMQLEKLVLFNATLNTTALLDATANHPHLRAVEMVEEILSGAYSLHILALFADLVEQHRWLDSLHLCDVHYCRSTAALTMRLRYQDRLGSGILSRVLQACSPVKILTLKSLRDMPELTKMITMGQLVGSSLRELRIVHSGQSDGARDGNSLTALASLCPAVRSVELQGLSHALTDHVLEQMALSWPHLERFQAIAQDEKRKVEGASFVTDLGMEALFTNCPQLKEVSMDHAPKLTSQTLQSILKLKHKLHLRRLTAGKGIDFGGSAPAFRQMAKEQQLLPVPQVKMMLDCSLDPAKQMHPMGAFIVEQQKQ